MARQNTVFLLGSVLNEPRIVKSKSEDQQLALTEINVVRGPRSVGDHRETRADHPWIVSREPAIIEKMSDWTKGDIVFIKGVIATRLAQKTSRCEHCGQKNAINGVFVYIDPIHIMKITHFDTDEECVQYLMENREVSNQVFSFGTLTRDPKRIRPKEGLTVTQYQIAMNRKVRIRTDDAKRTADFPWVKAYGKNANDDRRHLHVGSEIFVDGCLQARYVQRHNTCQFCGEDYKWKDKAMEIVPFATEYVTNYYTDEEADAIERERKEQSVRDLFKKSQASSGDDNIPEDTITDEDLADGFDPITYKKEKEDGAKQDA